MTAARALLLLAGALAAAGCGAEATAPPAPGSPVAARTAVAEIEDAALLDQATGTVEPWARVSPGTKILGRVEQVTVREGDRVTRGQLLARLERRDLEASAAQARAAVAIAEAGLDNADAQHRRMGDLHARGSVTDKNLEDARTAFRVAEAGLARAQADLEAARVALEYAEIRAPITGWVAARLVEAGDMVHPGDPLFRLDDLARVKISVALPESGLAGLAPGDPAEVRVDAAQTSVPATLDRILPAGDPQSRTFEVQFVLPNAEGTLKSGMFARVAFARGSRQALLVPSAALVRRGQLLGLFVVDGDGRARLRWIRAGQEAGERTEILSGLDAGQRYLVSPPPGLADGTPVTEG